MFAMENERDLYNEIKSRGISTLRVKSLLESNGIFLPPRTLQYHFDNDFKSGGEELKKCVENIIKSWDKFIKNVESYGNR